MMGASTSPNGWASRVRGPQSVCFWRGAKKMTVGVSRRARPVPIPAGEGPPRPAATWPPATTAGQDGQPGGQLHGQALELLFVVRRAPRLSPVEQALLDLKDRVQHVLDMVAVAVDLE